MRMPSETKRPRCSAPYARFTWCDTVRAQYAGYRDAEGVPPGSTTPTYAALKLHIDNWRWKGVPFYLRSGKAMAERTSTIIVEFQAPPDIMFRLGENAHFTPNTLAICIQPNEGIQLRFETKVPDTVARFALGQHELPVPATPIPGCCLPDAYERLLLDALKGDASLFARSDEIEARLAAHRTRCSAATTAPPRRRPLCDYAPGSWGPAAADELLARGGPRVAFRLPELRRRRFALHDSVSGPNSLRRRACPQSGSHAREARAWPERPPTARCR